MHDPAPTLYQSSHSADTEDEWTIRTPSLALRWNRLSSGEVQLTSLRTPGMEWVAAPTPMFIAAGDATTAIAFRDVTSVWDGATLRLDGTLDPLNLKTSVSFTVYAEHSVVLTEIEVRNEGDTPVEVGSLSSLCVTTPRVAAAQLAVLPGGRWDESMPPRGYRLETVDLDEVGGGRSIGAAEDGRSSGEHLPWFALLSHGGGLIASLVWSGRWSLDVERQDDRNSIALGISDFSHRLAPGECLALPAVVVGGYAGELDDGANEWRRWVLEHWMPPAPENWPWIQYNHWYAYYGDIDAVRLFEEAREAAQIGCEVFVIDDGWFRGRRPESYHAGWGDWVEDRSRFPDGINAFGDSVRDLGMKFGLWVEPERADEQGALVQDHPDWVATRGGEPIRRPGPAGAEGAHLCLGNPDVQRWMAGDMIRVVRDYGVDWLKWDYNIGYGLGCDAGNHGHQSTDGHHAHTLGLYSVLEDLRESCPDLLIENCASGGHRVDLGTLRHTHTNWVSDYTHRAASCRQHAQGAGLFLPLSHLNTWALDERDATEFRSRMGGAFGISSFIGSWSLDERAQFRQAVEEYKRLRPLLYGDRFLLTGPLHQDWDIWQFLHPSGNELAILAFHEAGEIAEVRVTPRVPVRDRSYRVQHSDAGTSEEVSGAALASNGIIICLPEKRASEIIRVTAVD